MYLYTSWPSICTTTITIDSCILFWTLDLKVKKCARNVLRYGNFKSMSFSLDVWEAFNYSVQFFWVMPFEMSYKSLWFRNWPGLLAFDNGSGIFVHFSWIFFLSTWEITKLVTSRIDLTIILVTSGYTETILLKSRSAKIGHAFSFSFFWWLETLFKRWKTEKNHKDWRCGIDQELQNPKTGKDWMGGLETTNNSEKVSILHNKIFNLFLLQYYNEWAVVLLIQISTWCKS